MQRYTRVLRLLVVLLGLRLLAGAADTAAQVTTSPVTTPNLPGTQAPPLPPRPRLETKPPSPQAPRNPLAIRFDVEAADQALLRRYRPRLVAPDTLEALRSVRELLLALQTDSYLTASADELHWRRDTLVVRLYVGEQFRWAQLQRGNVTEDVLSRSGFRERLYAGQPLRPAELARLQQTVLDNAENEGYPFAQVRLDSVQLRGADISARLHLERGPVVIFDSLQIIGKSKTRKRFLMKYLQIVPGQPYSQQRVDDAARLLRLLPYLQLREEPQVLFSRGLARVYLPIDDRNANQFDAIVGVLPNTNVAPGQKRVQITGDVTLNLRNIGGGGKQLGVQWRKVDAASQVLDAGYQHPNFFGTPIDVAGTFNLFKQNDEFLTLRPRLQLSHVSPRAGRLSVFVEQRNSRLLANASFPTLTVLPANVDSRYTAYGLDLNRSSLDDPLFPRRGTLLLATGAIGTKIISRNADLRPELYDGLPLRTTQTSLSARAEHYFRIGQGGVLMTRLRGEALLNQRLFLNDLFRLGGLSTLRGFNELQFYAAQYGIGTVELRQFTGPEAYVFVFADQAYLRQGLPGAPGEDAPTGLGAGLSFRTGAGVFQFVYSLGRTNSQPFSFSASKVHFGITSRF
ncbi:hypothetical protein EJV47_16700 [Hymenobacter gummosus]|uniref:Bacterial surface antigen (D15) domain-containing protein n=1 Tax=Hymenobacter gummosus TaxID=1776032 RepID=A0A431U110_9BACT|nr:BamA/TamA family outer membrane protein [Hymenobacter gummosus]RTQ48611.1 hypothetical protein EJV47_16700 [Hymenobacter gummosus]